MQETRRFPIWIRLLFAVSGMAYTILVMQTASKLSFSVTALLSLALLLGLNLKWGLLERLFAPRGVGLWIASGILAVSAVYTAKSTFFTNCWSWMWKLLTLCHIPQKELVIRLIPWAMALAALPMVLGYMLWFLDFFRRLGKRLWQESDFSERLFVLGAGILFAMMIVFTYLCTQAFHGAHLGNRWFNFDLIYSADSGYLVNQDVYRNIGAEQNDLRQPLFGLFAMPFAQVAWLLSRILFFLPRGYITIWQMIQMLLYLCSVVLLSRMMGLKNAEKALFLVMMSVTYPVLIFSLTAEQYLIAVFYLILMLYLSEDAIGGKLCFLGATGSLLTSGVWFPILTWDRNLKQFVRKTAALCLTFCCVTILCGRLTTFLDIPGYIAGYGYYTGVDVAPLQKLMQYVNFAGACIMAPPSGPDFTSYNHISWQMLPVTGWSVPGLLVIALSAGGILVSWRERFTRRCAFWLGFSFLLLGLVGWGTIDNGLMLYTLYFGWAFFAMGFRLLDWTFRRVRPVKIILMLALILLISLYNVYALRNVLIFGSQFYPTMGGFL